LAVGVGVGLYAGRLIRKYTVQIACNSIIFPSHTLGRAVISLLALHCGQAITISLGNKCDVRDSKQVDFNTANKWAQTEKGNFSDAFNSM